MAFTEELLRSRRWKRALCHACARTAALDTACWGSNADNKSGSLSAPAYVLSPIRVFGM
jgi:hypothetical protein